jgi:hypothetical protein
MKRVIGSDKPVTLLLLLWSQKCDFGAEPRSRIIATSAVKGYVCGEATLLVLLFVFFSLLVVSRKRKDVVITIVEKAFLMK